MTTVTQAVAYKHKTTRPTLEMPIDLWREVKLASIRAGKRSVQEFVVETLREKVMPKKKAS